MPRRVVCIALWVLTLTLLACANHTDVADAIKTQLRFGATQVDFERLDIPEWDRMFVFGPYTPKASVCSALQLSDWKCSVAGFDKYVDEGEHLLVFMSGKDVAQVERVPRFGVEFDVSCLSREFLRAKAKFKVGPVLTCPK